MTTYQREPAPSLWPEIMPLLIAHKEEIAHYADIALHPDEARYNAVEIRGNLRCYTARVQGVLVGYAIFFVDWNLHYCDSLQANQDVLFVMKEHRLSRVGLGLIRYSEEELRKEGVQACYHHIKVKTPQTIKLFERLGYEPVDLILVKRLDK